jgi:hypothetical protein
MFRPVKDGIGPFSGHFASFPTGIADWAIKKVDCIIQESTSFIYENFSIFLVV